MTKFQIVPYRPALRSEIVDLSIRAWAPVFARMEGEVLAYVYSAFYPKGWEARQRDDIAALLDDDGAFIRVAEGPAGVLGFVGVRLHPEDRMGEIHVLAVDPVEQRQGVGRALIAFAEDHVRDAGMEILMVETGGDSGHRPARVTYERAGFEPWPVARYFKRL